MPRGDRKGPDGMGPMTGRGAGYCAGYGRPGYSDVPSNGRGAGYGRERGGGRGYGRGFGRGRGGFAPGPRYIYPGPVVMDDMEGGDEKAHLEAVLERLDEEMNAVRKRLKGISK